MSFVGWVGAFWILKSGLYYEKIMVWFCEFIIKYNFWKLSNIMQGTESEIFIFLLSKNVNQVQLLNKLLVILINLFKIYIIKLSNELKSKNWKK